MRPLGVNTWVWTSPLTDANAPELLRTWPTSASTPSSCRWRTSATSAPPSCAGARRHRAGAVRRRRDGAGARPRLGAAERCAAPRTTCARASTSPHEIGAAAVCGPFTASTGRVWRMDADRAGGGVRRAAHAPRARRRARRRGRCPDRDRAAQPLRDVPGQHRGPGADRARPVARQPRRLAAWPLWTPTTSTSRSAPAPTPSAAAGDHLVHVQVCGSDRGAPGGDQTDWPALLAALDEVGYDGPLVLESFTADNASIATAASIWRPLAPTQDDLARDGLAFLRRSLGDGAPTPEVPDDCFPDRSPPPGDPTVPGRRGARLLLHGQGALQRLAQRAGLLPRRSPGPPDGPGRP